MKDVPLPVRVAGAGSQPAYDNELHCLAMPREMSAFRTPVDWMSGSCIVPAT